MPNLPYDQFREQMKERVRDLLGDAMQDIEDECAIALEKFGLLAPDYDEDELELNKLDQWVGLLIWEIVNDWDDNHTDPFKGE